MLERRVLHRDHGMQQVRQRVMQRVAAVGARAVKRRDDVMVGMLVVLATGAAVLLVATQLYVAVAG
jgi:hypothetical protein